MNVGNVPPTAWFKNALRPKCLERGPQVCNLVKFGQKHLTDVKVSEEDLQESHDTFYDPR